MKEENRMNLSDNLKKIRKEHNLSQEQLAESLGVSRQAVSKWESGGAYPEMDKVLQICKMFNVNIDDLLNQDIKKVNSSKQEKNNINKFIDDFLDYLTKTIDMFSSMKFKCQIKCIFEQLLLITVVIIVFLLLGAFCENIIQNILTFLPLKVSEIIYHLLEGIYLASCLVLGIILLFHIFKVRYLDYYQIIREEEKAEKKVNKNEEYTKDKEENDKVLLEKEKEKIIIRDPKHSEYKFIKSLLKVLLFILKSIAVLIALIFCLTLIFFVLLTVLSFMFVKTGFLFAGSLLIIISLLAVNIVILIIIYNFIVNRKGNKNKLAITFSMSLISIGIGIGLLFIGLTDFNVTRDLENDRFVEENIRLSMQEGIFFEDWHNNIKYIESDNPDVKIVYKHSLYYNISMNKETNGNYYYFYETPAYSNIMNVIRDIISDINNKQIIDYTNYEINIYTTRDNIAILKKNREDYFANQLQNTIDELYEELSSKENQIYELQEELRYKNTRIHELEEELNNYTLDYYE